jgi:hypothetical protein
MIYVAVYTGPRVSELAALKWNDVIAVEQVNEEGAVEVRNAVSIDERFYRGDWGAPKSDASHATIGINECMYLRVQRLKLLTVRVRAGNAIRRYKVVKANGPARFRRELLSVGRGLYRLAKAPPLTHPEWVTVASRIPRAVICLISALAHHRLAADDDGERGHAGGICAVSPVFAAIFEDWVDAGARRGCHSGCGGRAGGSAWCGGALAPVNLQRRLLAKRDFVVKMGDGAKAFTPMGTWPLHGSSARGRDTRGPATVASGEQSSSRLKSQTPATRRLPGRRKECHFIGRADSWLLRPRNSTSGSEKNRASQFMPPLRPWTLPQS